MLGEENTSLVPHPKIIIDAVRCFSYPVFVCTFNVYIWSTAVSDCQDRSLGSIPRRDSFGFSCPVPALGSTQPRKHVHRPIFRHVWKRQETRKLTDHPTSYVIADTLSRSNNPHFNGGICYGTIFNLYTEVLKKHVVSIV